MKDKNLIKFRAWDKGEKWMVYDVQDAYDGMWSERNSDEINDYYSYVSTFQSFTDEESFNFMQYTGLKDKSGIEVYEGDVLYHPLQGKRRVYYPYSDSIASYGLREINTGLGSILQDAHAVWEVIGNIHENPELLEVQDD